MGRSENSQLWRYSHLYLETGPLQALYRTLYGEEPEPGSASPAYYTHLKTDLFALADGFTAAAAAPLKSLDLHAAYNRLIQYPTYRIADVYGPGLILDV